MTLGTAIRLHRKAHILGLREVARRAGLNHGYLSRIERGEQHTTAHPFLRRVAEVLSIEYDWLCYLAGVLPQDVAKRQYSQQEWMAAMARLRGE